MNIIRNIAVAVLAAGISFSAGAAAIYDGDKTTKQEDVMTGNDYQIVKDETVDGIRKVTAVPSAKVCSKQIDIEFSGNIIRKVTFTKGCNGNAKGIGALIEGMSAEEAVRRLKGIDCSGRGTSCPDQLARVIEEACLR